MQVSVHWTNLHECHELWGLSRGLYCYTTPDGRDPIYLGKTDGTSIRRRWNADDKRKLWRFVERELGHKKHAIFAGEIELPGGYRLSRELLADIESLLIYRLSPIRNQMCVRSRISREGLSVRCLGAWPFSQRVFRDSGFN